jgi:uncharacterized protein YggE
LAFSVAVTAIFCNIPTNAASEEMTGTTAKFISVSGTGSVNISPDMAYISLGVITEEIDSQTALAKNNIIIDAVTKAVKSFGVDDNDIQTDRFSIYPKYNYNNYKSDNSIIGYSVNNVINVTVRNLDNLGKILDAAIKAGANNSTNISFDYSKRSEKYLEALKSATENAKKEAEAIASAFGNPKLTIIEVNEVGNNSLYYGSVYGNPATSDGGSVPVEIGELKVSATVSVKYSFE